MVPTRQRVKIAILLASVIALATTSALAGRWDPTYGDELPTKPGTGAMELPADLRLPQVEEFLPKANHFRPGQHWMTLDLRALTLDGREIARTPADPSSPLLLPGDVLVPRSDAADYRAVYLAFDARTPFAFIRAAMRALLDPPRGIYLMVERDDGARGVLDILAERSYWDGRRTRVHIHAGTVRIDGMTVDGMTIPPLPSGAVDVPTLRRVFRPKWSPSVFVDDDTPFGDVVAVIGPYANSEFTDPVLEL